MKFLEKDLEEIIWNADKELLSERGLFLLGHLKRQVRIGNYGIADLVHFYRPQYDIINGKRWLIEDGLIEIIELKNESVSISAFMQAVRYVKGIQRYLEKRGFDDSLFKYRITLIGRKYDTTSDLIFLPDLFTNGKTEINLYRYDFDLNGISFTEELSYHLTKEGF